MNPTKDDQVRVRRSDGRTGCEAGVVVPDWDLLYEAAKELNL